MHQVTCALRLNGKAENSEGNPSESKTKQKTNKKTRQCKIIPHYANFSRVLERKFLQYIFAISSSQNSCLMGSNPNLTPHHNGGERVLSFVY